MVPSKNVMIVDDEEMLRSVYGKILARAGYSVFAFKSPDEVLSALSMGAKVDLLLSDFDMRAAMNGAQLATAIRAAGHAFPILLCSAAPPAVLPPEFAGVLEKPFGIEVLRNAVAQVLAGEAA